MLWITSGERQKFDPAQDMAANLGKVIRLRDDGSVPDDNPFAHQGGVAAQVWSLGHRNPLGIAFDGDGRLWVHEMGPKGGDELNLVEKGANYGYPVVSNGDHYDGKPIPDHDTRPEFKAPLVTWTPVISPAGFVIYSGDRYPGWKGSGLIGGLSSQALVRVGLDGTAAREVERYGMGTRIREVEQGPDGTVWLLEDGGRGANGRLYRLDPRAN
jgi:aldose sugar dehydrogenase